MQVSLSKAARILDVPYNTLRAMYFADQFIRPFYHTPSMQPRFARERVEVFKEQHKEDIGSSVKINHEHLSFEELKDVVMRKIARKVNERNCYGRSGKAF